MLKRFWISLFIGLITYGYTQEIKGKYEGKVTVEQSLSYVLDYPKDAKKAVPLVVFLHGSGERGNDLEKVKLNGIFKYKSLIKEPVALLAPQCPENQWWDTQAVFNLIKNIQKKYKIDESRIYLTGLSMGGWGVWKLANEHPNLFAAIAPVCGASDRWMRATTHRYKELPIKIFHGGNDDIVSPMNSIEMYQQIKKINKNVELVIFPDDNHNAWDSTYSDSKFYEWLLSNKK